uniref:Uncharacterized protein n=1 Tax=Moniliophthora roreri TaxID=221103 RepID=A0A0W0FDF8_MONRR
MEPFFSSLFADQTYTASMENDSTPQTHPEAHFPDHHIESLHNSSTSHDHHVGHGFQQDDYTHDELSVTPARQPNTAHHEWHPTHHDQSDAGHHPKHSPHRHRHRRPSNPPPYSYPHHDSTLPPPQTIFGDDSPMQSSTYFNSSEEEGSGYKALLFLFLTWVFFIGFVLYLSPWWDRERGWVGPGYGRDHYP